MKIPVRPLVAESRTDYVTRKQESNYTTENRIFYTKREFAVFRYFSTRKPAARGLSNFFLPCAQITEINLT